MGFVNFFFFVSYFIPCFTDQILYNVALEFKMKILTLIVIFVLKIDFLFSLAIVATMATDLRAEHILEHTRIYCPKKNPKNVDI